MQKIKTVLYHTGSWSLFILQLILAMGFGYDLETTYPSFTMDLFFNCIGFTIALNLIFYGIFGKYAYPLMKLNH